MYKLEDFEPGTLLYLLYFNIENSSNDGEYICKVYKTEYGDCSYNDKIWVNDIWEADGELGEKEFIYLDDFNSNSPSSVYIFIDECYYPDLMKLIDELPEPTKVTNFIKSIYPEHFV
ncbi:hypothetical protein WCWAEYFT_CDS0244 [Vibrio phage VB_VaC_TDDLMA]